MRRAGVILLALPGLLGAQALPLPTPPAEAGGTADIALQGYYLGGNSQPITALSGTSIAFREYWPSLGLITGNIEGYDDSTRGRTGLNFVTLHGLKWKGRRWTLTGGDFLFKTALVPAPFSNYSFPEIGARGAKVEMADGRRRYTLFAGEETLQAGPRVTFRTTVPQTVLGAAVEQDIGSRLHLGARYLGLSSGAGQIASEPNFFPEGSQFRRSDSLSIQAGYAAGHGLTLWGNATVSHEAFAASALYTRTAPFSSVAGARWQTKRLTVTANYGSLSRSALPVLGYYFGDRRGPFAEVRYKVYRSFELFGSGSKLRNNLEGNPNLALFSSQDATAGASVILPGGTGISGQYSKIELRGLVASDPSQNQSQHSTQSQATLSKTIRRHSVLLTARDLNLTTLAYSQKQRSAEFQDNAHFSRLLIGGAVRMQQQFGAGQLQNSVFVRGSLQLRLRGFSVYGQYETGNDLINKSLFATNSVRTTVAGAQIPVMRGWNVQAEAFRTSLLAALNPASILVLQTEGTGVADILNNFNQWSFFLRLNRRAHWGAALPEAESVNNEPIYGAIEGFVFDDAEGSHGAEAVSVQLDKARTATTDSAGHYRFADVPEGAHAVSLNMAELAADLSPGPAPPASIVVKPRGVARVDLRVVKAGSSIRGSVRGLAAEDLGVVRLDSIVVNLSPVGGEPDARKSAYTTCDSGGEFAFYNLAAGRYSVSLDRNSLPEDYVLISEGDLKADLGNGADPPPMAFRIEKHVKQLPVRKVFESGIN